MPGKAIVRELPDEYEGPLHIVQGENSTKRGVVVDSGIPDVPTGATVRWASEYCGEPVESAGEALLVMQEHDLLATEQS